MACHHTAAALLRWRSLSSLEEFHVPKVTIIEWCLLIAGRLPNAS